MLVNRPFLMKLKARLMNQIGKAALANSVGGFAYSGSSNDWKIGENKALIQPLLFPKIPCLPTASMA